MTRPRRVIEAGHLVAGLATVALLTMIVSLVHVLAQGAR